jgi:hypothetical protein
MATRAKGSKGEGADYRRFLESRLRRGAQRVRGADIATGVALILVVWVCSLLSSVVLDQLFELPAWARALILAGAIIATIGLALWWIVRPMLRSVNMLYTARSVESAKPGLKNSFLNWTELSRKSDEIPDVIMKNIETRAAQDIARIKIEDAIQPRYVLPALYTMAAVVVLFCLYTRLTSKDLLTSFQRVLLPLAGVRPPTSTQLRITFDPGEKAGTEPTPLPAGAALTIKGAIERGQPTSITAYVRTDGTEYDEPHLLSPTSIPSEFVLTLPQRQKSFEITLVADDFRSRTYRIPVTAAPMITDWLLTYTPPAYTLQSPFTSTQPDIDGLEGTRVQIQATSNLPVRSTGALIELTQRTVDMKLVEGSTNTLAGEVLLDKDGTYRIKFQDTQGRAPDFRPIHHIRVRVDQPPQVEFLSPAQVETDWPADRPLSLRAKIADDFGLRRARLVIEKNPSSEPAFDQEKGGPGESLGSTITWEESLTADQLKAKAGDVFEYWFEAFDSKLPISNEVSTRSQRRRVKVVPPLESKENRSKENRSSQPKPGPQPAEDEIAQRETGSAKPESGEQGGEKKGANETAEADGSNSGESAAGEKGSDVASADRSSDPSSATSNGDSKESSSGSGSESQASQSDRQAMEKLQKYFDKNKPSSGSESTSGAEPKDEGSSAQSPPSDPSSPDSSKTGSSASSKNDSSSDGKKQASDASSDSSKSGGSQEASDSGMSPEKKIASQEGAGSNESKPGGSAEQSSSSSKAGQPSDAGDQPSPKGDQAPPSSNPPDSSSQQSKSSSDQGKENESPKNSDGVPKPEGTGSKDSPRSSKQGSDNASASPEGNTDGSASQAESGTPEPGAGEKAAGKDGQADTVSQKKESGSSLGDAKEQRADESAKGSSGDPPQGSTEPSPSKENSAEKGEKKSGEGESSSKAGSEAASSPESKSSGEKGASSENKDGASKPGKGDSDDSASPSSKDGGEMLSGGKPGQQDAGLPNEAGPSKQANDDLGEKANPEDKQKGSNLVLRELADELKNKKVDPNLLKEMGWTEEDAKKFYERMQAQGNSPDKSDPLSAAKRKGFGEGTDLRKSTGRSAGKSVDQMQDLYSGRRTPPPPEVRKRYEAYMKSLAVEGAAPSGTSPAAPPSSAKP